MTPGIAALLAEPAPIIAPALLGATIAGRGVTLRITEVEAYSGPTDPGSHGNRGMTERNRHLFGPPGTLYAYRSYGIHTCVNVVSGPAGTSSGSLLRGAEVVEGLDVARARRGSTVADVALARGPGNLGGALGAVLGQDDGTSLLDGSGPFVLTLAPGLEARLASAGPAHVVDELLSETLAGPPAGAAVPRISRGPRTGVGGIAGGVRYPWRFWLTGDPTVSTYRRHKGALDS
ncbi:DNA-3-methyladenine glycosylase [Curtobacterium flaccumfaciens]|uniref:DNA-3-methyladenine glycosylase n=1 Tax=Curtobacterium flaccumfaciens TaxID=2035 RepID=UPI001BDE6456|nr:DNA-3-methyladenine glycosylase [Curtobacterium flaccumfaciens]MBT1606029.1 DNA-3-methyladenine glycosylase [Curtobacterium flaccumfaciens pv. betae]MBT1656468.1 DNA-3-methyladenine glycosylase [Curtobacterium flaccumfaciens pv. betae]MCS0470642.1 DNA-3-methyladenine glycosylase [Curtobacterium flaccumfaciens pv. betae]MCS0473676.1 DNA-3-methyladenine glycosylase [Curtobacterium flaccumfaciens pv. betae]MCS0477054.1 DNA-3-methyladenine glycosylase [Curtobacterium flaccumfaciens pv. betae]